MINKHLIHTKKNSLFYIETTYLILNLRGIEHEAHASLYLSPCPLQINLIATQMLKYMYHGSDEKSNFNDLTSTKCNNLRY
jgi:hypothetical protein